MRKEKKFRLYLRNSIFGVEDSLVSTVGLLSGIAVANVEKETILLAGVVLIFVEALSMSAGSFLSEQSVQEYKTKNKASTRFAVTGAIIMFISYFVSGFVPLAPYVFFDKYVAFWSSIGISFVFLFILGAISASLFKGRIIMSGLRMLIVGGAAISIGVLVGTVLH